MPLLGPLVGVLVVLSPRNITHDDMWQKILNLNFLPGSYQPLTYFMYCHHPWFWQCSWCWLSSTYWHVRVRWCCSPVNRCFSAAGLQSVLSENCQLAETLLLKFLTYCVAVPISIKRLWHTFYKYLLHQSNFCNKKLGNCHLLCSRSEGASMKCWVCCCDTGDRTFRLEGGEVQTFHWDAPQQS